MGLDFLFVGQLGQEPIAAWFDIALFDMCKRLSYLAPGSVPPAAEPSHILDELHHVQSDPSYTRAVDMAREVLEGAQEVAYRGGDGLTLTLLLVGNQLAGLIGTPRQGWKTALVNTTASGLAWLIG